jgi:hypothetical protein
MNRVEEILTLNGALRRSYTRLPTNFTTNTINHFSKMMKRRAMRRAMSKVMSRVMMRVKLRQGPLSLKVWLMICGSFDEKLWKVNLINLNLQCCYRYAWNTTL